MTEQKKILIDARRLMNVYDYLWSDPEFLEKRVKEQIEYILITSERKDVSYERKKELIEPAFFVYEKFRKRLEEVSCITYPSKLNRLLQ